MEPKVKTRWQQIGLITAGAAVLANTTGCTPRIPSPGPKNQSTEYSETLKDSVVERELCDCCDYSTGGYAYHGEFDPHNPRIEAGTELKNGIFKPDSHNWKNINGVCLFIGKEGIEAEDDGVFWGMRCKDEMPQTLMGEEEHWADKVVVIIDSLDERELQQLDAGELNFLGDKLMVIEKKDINNIDEIIKAQD